MRLEDGFEPIEVEKHYREVLLVVSRSGSVVGEVVLPAVSLLPEDVQRSAVVQHLGDRLWQLDLTTLLTAPPRSASREHQPLTYRVSVVVCTRDRPDQLRRCLESLLELTTPAHELIVVDNCPTDDRTRTLCASLPVRYLEEPLAGLARARNRGIVEASGDVVAFTDDDCVADPHWLDDLDDAFSDVLVKAVTGFVAPVELDTPAQYLFQAHGGFERRFTTVVYDGAKGSPVLDAGRAGPGANVIFRREVFREVGLFAEDLGRGTPARSSEDAYALFRVLSAGYRVVYQPSRVVWHCHRSDATALSTMLMDDASGSSAFATRCLVRHRELGAIRVWGWWLFHHVPRDLKRVARRDDDRVPIGLTVRELLGTLAGPWRLMKSRRSRRSIPPIEFPSQEAPAATVAVGISPADPPLSVALASYNRRELLRKVLDSLAKQDYPADRFEVVVVLDGSTDASAEMARGLEVPFRLRVLEQDNSGLSATRNRGAREATNPVIVFLDDDIVVESRFLAAHALAHRTAKDEVLAMGAYPPAVVDEDGFWALQTRAWWSDHFRRKAELDHQWTYIDFCDGNASMTRALFAETGGWDEDFKGGRRQDWEYAVRLLQRGVRFEYVPRASGRHHLDTSFETALRNRRQEAFYDVLLATKHPQVMGQLPIGAYAYPHGIPSERGQAIGLRRLELLESLRLRRRWRSLVRRLLRDAYLLGLGDALSPAGFLDLVAGIWTESVEIVPFPLDQPRRLEVVPGAGSIELEVEYAGTSLGRVLAMDPDGQWEWASVAQRVVSSVWRPARQAAVLEELAAAESRGDVPAARTPGLAR